MQSPHWDYFLTLAEDVKAVTRFVEPAKENFKAFSIEFARLYLAIGSEIDVVAKLLCQSIDSGAKLDGINTYRPIILSKYPDMPSVETLIPRSGLTLIPWQSWSSGVNPDWWQSYNDVKHERNKNFADANLENTLNSLAGLMVMCGYLYAESLRNAMIGLETDSSIIRFSARYLGTSKTVVIRGARLPGVPEDPWIAGKWREAQERQKRFQ